MQRGASPSAPAPQRPPASIINAAPSSRVEHAYFHAIDVNAPVIPAGMAAVYGLRRIQPSTTTGLGIALLHMSTEMLPSDSVGVGAGFPNPIAWGDSKGLSAKIVVGRNLDMIEGDWKAGWFDLPGIDLGNATPDARTLRNARSPAQYYGVFNLPAGAYNDADVLMDVRERPLAATAARVGQGETLDVALVLKGTQIDGLTGVVSGMAHVALVCVDLRSDPRLGGT